MITYDELKTTLTDISNICRMTDCDKCPLVIDRGRGIHNDYVCLVKGYTPNNWIDEIPEHAIEQFAARGAHLVEEGYIDE